MTQLAVGIIGTGNISDAYLRAAPNFPILDYLSLRRRKPRCRKFQGDIKISEKGGDWVTVPQVHAYGAGYRRILGLADMAHAIVNGHPHRAGLDLALHVLEVIGVAPSTFNQQIMIYGCERPEALSAHPSLGIIE